MSKNGAVFRRRARAHDPTSGSSGSLSTRPILPSQHEGGRMGRRVLWSSVVGVSLMLAGLDQAVLTRAGGTAQTLAFDVASVRENVGGSQGGYVVRPDGLSVTNY